MFQKEFAVATTLARAAGERILAHYRTDFAVQFKNGIASDPVTAADTEANALIVEGLGQAFPDDAILAEESPLEATRHAKKRLWCVDPLDGTQEFVARNGQFAVMIGLAIDGEARLGVVYQPTEDVLWAGAGGRAWREHGGETTPLRPSEVTDPARAVMMVSRAHRSATVSAVANALGIMGEEPLGSVGLKVVRIAEGAAELYLSLSSSTQEWDACAPEAILRAAGGIMSDCLGEPLRYNKATPDTPFGLLASNGLLHTPLVGAAKPIALQRRS